MKRTSVPVTIGALLVAATAIVAPAQASALGRHAPSVKVPVAAQVAAASHHPAATSDQQQITSAILHSPLLGAVSPDNVAVSQIRFAGEGWAGAVATPKNGQTDPAQVLLHKTGSTWQVRDLGTASVGCGIAPAAVRAQLGLHGPCRDFCYDSSRHREGPRRTSSPGVLPCAGRRLRGRRPVVQLR